jgi:hypothetical protein
LDVKKLGRELNVRYVLVGWCSVLATAWSECARSTLKPATTSGGAFYKFADLFDMQDEIVSRLANALDTELIAARPAERSVHRIQTRWTWFFKVTVGSTRG